MSSERDDVGGVLAEAALDAPLVVRADSTPLVEGFHVVLHHLIVFRLKELIANEAGHLS